MHIETLRTTSATPEVLFHHLEVPEAWRVWGRFPQARLERPGTGEKYGVGSIRRIWPAREETVAYRPSEHYAYRLLGAGPVRDYRADVRLDARPDGGTDLRWAAALEPRIPGTAPLARLVFRGMIGYLAAGLVRHCEHCTPGCPAHNAV